MLDSMLFNVVQKQPKKTSLVYDDRRISYEQLYSDVCGFADGLSSIGIGHSDCVALILPNCIEFVISFYAASRLKSIVLPINPLLKKDEIKYYLSDCNVQLIITNTQHVETCREIIDELNSWAMIVLVDKKHPQAYYFYDMLGSGPRSSRASEHYTGDVLYQYSSGSTGRPKRVVRTQENLFYEAHNFTSTVHVSPDDAILCLVPLFHSHGLGNCLLAATSTGATLVILEQFVRDGHPVEVPFVSRSPRVLELLQAEKITILPGVPYVFNTLAEAAADTDLSSLRLCFSAGNFLPKQIFDQFLQRFNIPVMQLYGCTEAGSVSINMDPDTDSTWNSVGLPLGSTQITIADEQANEVPNEEVGEIVIKSRGLTSGYFNMAETNKEAFRDGCFFTGDLGKKDAQGRLYITGRKKIFIDTGGHKVDPLEVEDVLTMHPHISEVVVVGVESRYGGEIVKAVIVAQDTCTEDEIIAYCRSRLADFKIPRIVEFIDEIPKSPLGKVLRKNLIQSHVSKQQHLKLDQNIRQSLISEDSKEQRQRILEVFLREQVGQLLRLDGVLIDLRRPLSEAGLTSALAIEFKARLEDIIGVPLSAALVWNYPSITDLAAYLADVVSAQRSVGAEGATLTNTSERDELAANLKELEQRSEDDIEQLLHEMEQSFLSGDADTELAEIQQLSEDEVNRIFFREVGGKPGEEEPSKS